MFYSGEYAKWNGTVQAWCIFECGGNAHITRFHVLYSGDRHATADEIERNYTFFINNIELAESREHVTQLSAGMKIGAEQRRTLFVGYRQLTKGEVDKYSPTSPPPMPYPYKEQINVTLDLRAFQSACNHIKPGGSQWNTDGCTVGAFHLLIQLGMPRLLHNHPKYVIMFQSTDGYLKALRLRYWQINVIPTHIFFSRNGHRGMGDERRFL